MKDNLQLKLKQFVPDLLKKNIICKACIRIKEGRIINENFGDDLNYYFLKDVFNKNISLFDYSILANHINVPNYLFIGSIIEMFSDSNSIIWGAGCISADQPFHKPRKVLAVRGPLTRRRFLEKGIECPSVYGDPALLLPLYYKPQNIKKYQFGIIPHYSDINTDFINKLRKILPNSTLIDMRHYKSYQDIVTQICSCEIIISSSLHGLIVAEAYKIPNIWIKCSNNIIGGEFKYHDFFYSVGKECEKPIEINNIKSVNDITSIAYNWKASDINLTQLINNAPFKITKLK